MIKLTKRPKPQILIDNGEAWTKVLVNKIAAGQKPSDAEKTRYRHPEIKQSLITETDGKCAYCESKLLHIQYGDIEHIYPKSEAPAKSFVWENLTLACDICNTNKSDHDPVLENIIDPYLIDPSSHLYFLGPILYDNGTPLGISTRSLLELNRIELVERRHERLDRLTEIFKTLLRQDLSFEVKKVIYDDMVNKEGGSSSAYSAMVVDAINAFKGKLPKEITS